MLKKILSIMLAVTMAVCLLPTNTFAVEYYGGTISSDVAESHDTIQLNADTTIAEGVTFALTSAAHQYIDLCSYVLTNYGTITKTNPDTNLDGGTFYNYGVCEITVFYDVTIYDLTLSSIALSYGTLSPSFAAGTREYAVTVDNSVTSIDITPTLNTGTGVKSMTVNGTAATSGVASTVSLDVGENSIPIVITASDGSDTANTYTLTVTREEPPTYTVRWLDEDGTELEKDTDVAYGITPSYDGEIPTKAAGLQYHYTFNGWTPEVSDVTGDATYKATYTQTAHTIETQNAKKATCTEDGYTGDEVCTVCGETISTGEVIPATGHTEVIDQAVEATCTETGLTEGSHCSVCNEVIVAQEVVAATGHSYEAVVTEPTCTEGGYTTYTCSVCGDSYVADETAATGHSYTVSWSWDGTSATATVSCSDCGDSYEQKATITTQSNYGQTIYIAIVRVGDVTYSSSKTTGTITIPTTDSTSEVITEEVETTEPVEGTDTETEADDEAEDETNPTTGMVLALLPMAIALAGAVAGKKRLG